MNDFDAFGFQREDGLYDEKCLKCGKLCDVSWQETSPSQKKQKCSTTSGGEGGNQAEVLKAIGDTVNAGVVYKPYIKK